jgi:NCS2 family nucleobase:cation symporter-2
MSDLKKSADPNDFPPLGQAVPLGIQHILAMFTSNVTPPFLVALAAGLGGADLTYMIQMAMVFAGIATLIQTVGIGPVGARLPLVQGTSFAFIPVMIPVAKTSGMGAVIGGVIIGGVFHFFLGSVIGRIRSWFPPMVTGVVILGIGLALLPVGVKYAAGGVPLMGKEAFGAFEHWLMALTVVVTTVGFKFFVPGFLSSAALLLGVIAGYIMAGLLGLLDFGRVANAGWFALPQPFRFGFEVNAAAIIGMVLMSIVSAIETVGDISAVTKGGANREATDKEISGGTMADGLGTAIAGLFGALPNTTFSQNVGVVSLSGVMSRHVVTIGAIFLIVAGLIPKFGALIAVMPSAVLGGAVVVSFGLVVSAGISMLSEVHMSRRNLLIMALSIAFGLGLQQVPDALQHVPGVLKLLGTSGLVPMVVLAVVLNLVLPEKMGDDKTH